MSRYRRLRLMNSAYMTMVISKNPSYKENPLGTLTKCGIYAHHHAQQIYKNGRRSGLDRCCSCSPFPRSSCLRSDRYRSCSPCFCLRPSTIDRYSTARGVQLSFDEALDRRRLFGPTQAPPHGRIVRGHEHRGGTECWDHAQVEGVQATQSVAMHSCHVHARGSL